jgi:hypothetical protein
MKTFSATHRLKMTTAIVAVSFLAACNPSAPTGNTQTAAAALPALPATLPLAAGAATSATAAPPVAALPNAAAIGAVRVARPDDRYAYAESARSFSDAIGSAPPDYGFDYDEVRPWAWQGYDESTEFVEPVDGGYRYYYYRPGVDTPYFVRDPDYGYGYDGGQLAVVYARDGSVIPYDAYGARLDYAARYYARARALYAASRQRHAVIAANWAARQAAIDAAQQHWAAQRAAQRDWQAYHDRVAAAQEQHWAQEQARRRADTARYDAWHDQDFRTPPPPRAIPVAWAGAAWAGNARNYAPPAPGFDGDVAARQQATRIEQQRVAAPAAHPAPVTTDIRVPAEQHPPQVQPKVAPIAPPPAAKSVPTQHPRPDRAPPEARPVPAPHQAQIPQQARPERPDAPHAVPEPPANPHASHERPNAPHAAAERPASAPRAEHRTVPATPERPTAPPQRRSPPEARQPVSLPPQRAPERSPAAPPRAPTPHAPVPAAHVEAQAHPAAPAHDRPAPGPRSDRP